MPYKDKEVKRARSKAHYIAHREAISNANKGRRQHIENAKRWNKANPEEYSRNKRKALCRKHGITLEIYEAAEKEQDGCCALCLNPERVVGRFMAIDHDHKHCPGPHGCSVYFRGLLCSSCNLALGHLKDNIQILLRAVLYITRKVVTCTTTVNQTEGLLPQMEASLV